MGLASVIGSPILTVAGEVYLAFCDRVNRRVVKALPATGAAILVGLIVLTGGCQSARPSNLSTSPRIDGIGTGAQTRCVGVSYSLEKTLRTSNSPRMELVDRDFENVRKMGIDVILLRHVSPEHRARVLEIAQSHGLQLVWPNLGAMHRVNGTGSPSAKSLTPKSPVISGHYLGHIVDDDTLALAKSEADRVRRSNSGMETVVRMDAELISANQLKMFDHIIAHDPQYRSADNRPPTNGGLQTLRCGRFRGGTDATVRGWLLAYHRGLASGRTAGLIIEDFRTLPGDIPGLVSDAAPLSPERISMVQRIASRAKRWRSVLTGLSPVKVATVNNPPADVEVALLSKGSRRCVLLINSSTGDFARGEVALPVELNGTPVVRAVAVPAESAGGLGDVIRARTDRIVFPVELAPGDAELFELF